MQAKHLRNVLADPVRVAREAEGPRDLVVQLRHPPGRRDDDRRAREAQEDTYKCMFFETFF